jgi:hypothetical protein
LGLRRSPKDCLFGFDLKKKITKKKSKSENQKPKNQKTKKPKTKTQKPNIFAMPQEERNGSDRQMDH